MRKKQIALMKKSAFLVNCSRGEILDEAALADAIRNREIAGAALDVYEEEPPVGSQMLAVEPVSLTPHLGALTREAQVRVGETVAEDVLRAISGEKPHFCVNPEALR